MAAIGMVVKNVKSDQDDINSPPNTTFNNKNMLE
jgi:hypothetical protein